LNPRFRATVFWAHLTVGVVAGLFILNMAVSGILIAYRVPITEWAEQSQRTIAVPQGQERLEVETLIRQAQEIDAKTRFFRMTHYSDPARAEEFYGLGDNPAVLFLDPYTGQATGEGQKGVRGFFAFMTGWHRWLAMSGGYRPTGKAITGAVSLAFFAMLLSGLCLWLPKKWSAKSLRPITVFRGGLSGKARDWNWHNVFGIWWAPLILITTLTGLLMSYTWAQSLLDLAVGSPPPVRQAASPKPKTATLKPAVPPTASPVARLNPDGLNQLFAVAEEKMPGWHMISFVLPYSPDAPANFFISCTENAEGRPDLTAHLVLDRHTGAVLTWDPYEKKNRGEKLQSWVVALHTGAIGGLIGQTLAALSACGAIMLVWTGLSLASRRLFASRGTPLAVNPAGPVDRISETQPPHS
jgi:uncharacterized iron-regulated membrane protein